MALVLLYMGISLVVYSIVPLYVGLRRVDRGCVRMCVQLLHPIQIMVNETMVNES